MIKQSYLKNIIIFTYGTARNNIDCIFEDTWLEVHKAIEEGCVQIKTFPKWIFSILHTSRNIENC